MDSQHSLDQASVAHVGAWHFTPGASRFLGGKTDGFRRRLLATVERRLATEGSPVIVKCDDQPPVIANGLALSDGDANSFVAAAAVTVTRLDDLPVPSEAMLKRLFAFSAAEVRVAQALARGESLREIATTLRIKITTARTELGSIFAKTDTRRQAHLVAVLSHLAHLEC